MYTLYEYSPDYRLLKAEEEDRDKAFTFAHDEDGQRAAKYRNDELVEAYQWLDFVRLAAFYDGRRQYEFAYRDGERTPFAMRRDDGEVAGLFYDQVGSLRVVADVDDNVIKEVLYDPSGGIIEDTNPDLRLPLGFAGGLHDRDLGSIASAGATTTSGPADGPRPIRWATRAAIRTGMGIVWTTL